ncbi:uncharacterized protein LOC118746358 [Rhagoletis pomonella]|uniref:uncharacterized protein LOC118746358 n=1 Tax=Rhagoletis pomonella TaxID=28610 RepID=UPI00177F1333|nr:uncharacterized protein LOC118746358 [Rhagoletis pomonella]
MSYIPDDASSMSDDVFEDPETTQRRLEETVRHRVDFSGSGGGSSGLGSSIGGSSGKACSTGYPGYRPPVKALQMYALEDAVFHDDAYEDEYEDGWRSYRYDEVGMYNQPQQQPFDDTVNHKTILLGDSGVGKTSFLVKYNTGEFRLGSFSATVGIALTLIVDIIRRRSISNAPKKWKRIRLISSSDESVHTLEVNSEPLQMEESNLKSRKRTRNPRNYAQNIRKMKRNSGEEYETKESKHS